MDDTHNIARNGQSENGGQIPTADLLPELHNLILAEVYLASPAPVRVRDIWRRLRLDFEPDSLVAFARAMALLEEMGFLDSVTSITDKITPKGEMYLFGLLLCGLMPDSVLQKIGGRAEHRDALSVEGATKDGAAVAAVAPVTSIQRINFELKQQNRGFEMGGYHDPAEDGHYA